MKARWEKRGYLLTTHPVETLSIITVCLFQLPPFLSAFRHRSYISGLNLRSVLRIWPGLRHCLQVENESPAPPVIPVSITTTQPPVHHAHPGPILMEWNVPKTLIYLTFLIFFHLPFCFLRHVVCAFHCSSPQHVSIALQALSPPWITSTSGGMFFPPTWRHPALMSATPSVIVWMVGAFFIFNLSVFWSFWPKYCTVICTMQRVEWLLKAW